MVLSCDIKKKRKYFDQKKRKNLEQDEGRKQMKIKEKGNSGKKGETKQ